MLVPGRQCQCQDVVFQMEGSLSLCRTALLLSERADPKAVKGAIYSVRNVRIRGSAGRTAFLQSTFNTQLSITMEYHGVRRVNLFGSTHAEQLTIAKSFSPTGLEAPHHLLWSPKTFCGSSVKSRHEQLKVSSQRKSTAPPPCSYLLRPTKHT